MDVVSPSVQRLGKARGTEPPPQGPTHGAGSTRRQPGSHEALSQSPAPWAGGLENTGHTRGDPGPTQAAVWLSGSSATHSLLTCPRHGGSTLSRHWGPTGWKKPLKYGARITRTFSAKGLDFFNFIFAHFWANGKRFHSPPQSDGRHNHFLPRVRT